MKESINHSVVRLESVFRFGGRWGAVMNQPVGHRSTLVYLHCRRQCLYLSVRSYQLCYHDLEDLSLQIVRADGSCVMLLIINQ